MGHRISISLIEVINHPDLDVAFNTIRHEPQFDGDEVLIERFASMQSNQENLHYLGSFSWDVEGDRLARDFNFFRNVEAHTEVMRFLFEHSIAFHVV
jgi:hypothetical protein